ncbi:LysE/ArgO family amino acid transporter [Micromonospora sp. RL09-050-HVF-A]|uniref:LysE/ArgO family amino acid transporter n=1 Tax=Micromonospora sp. RL09-050-HVF-A TaxID=1703433 RepID=UPI001C5CD423|nr:LysE/ArgO family amino acid transporter [Micromonospora sp. RL09-050-HVF-A]MBW4701239.1 amino acid transporter [Micromonospora sp. RL09-050-HVF-A]
MGSVLAGFGFSLALIVAIGAQNAFVLRQGLRREHVLPVVAICVAGDATLMAAGIAGLGALLTGTPAVLTAVRWGGVAFLLGYAVLAARRALRPTTLTPLDRPPATLRATLLACLAFTFLNPHVYLDTVVLLGTVAHQDPNRWAFGAGAVTASLVWFAGLGLGARRLGPVLAHPAAWRVIDGVIAVIMVVVAVSVAVG